MDTTMNLYRAPGSWSRRQGMFGTAPTGSRARRVEEHQALIQERDRLQEQLNHIRELADRVMTSAEEKDRRIVELEAKVQHQEQLIRDLESENDALINQVSAREDKIAMLEGFLKMIAEADSRVP